LRFRHVLPLAIGLPVRLLAQTPTDSASLADGGVPVVRAVELHRRDIFDPEERSWYARVANALHIQTRPSTVRRELLFQPGELYDSARVAESERNLRALGVFRRVVIDSVRTDSGLVVRVTTKDGWSTKADWRFRSAGGDVSFTIGLVEDNLFGTASAAAIRYRKNPDRSSIALSLRRPRLLAGTVGVGLAYEDRTDGRLAALALERPFFAMTSRHRFRLEWEDQDLRVLRFFEGEAEARDTLTRRYTLVRGSYARALRAAADGYLRLGVLGQVRRDDYLPEGSGLDFPGTVTGAIGPYITWNRASFLVARGVAGFAREEDVDLGITLRLGLLAAPKAFGYQRDGIGPFGYLRVGTRTPGGFGYLEALGSGIYSTAGLDSGTVRLAATAVLQPTASQAAILHVEGGWTRQPPPGQEFDLGLGVGPRAFGDHAFTGDRVVFASAEYRLTLLDDFLGLVGLGIAGFVEHGGAWYAGSPRRLGWDAGMGIRLGATRSTDTEALRFDLARRFANDVEGAGWVVTVGKGFLFSPLGP
jgi:hypothetical protein